MRPTSGIISYMSMKINISAPANPLGYGVVGINILKGFHSLGYDVAYWPIGQAEVDPSDAPMIQEMINNQEEYCSRVPSLKIWHQHDLAQHVGRGQHCAFPIFELDTFTKRELCHLSQQDVIFTCSKWAAEIVLTNLRNYDPVKDYFDEIRVYTAPLGVDRKIFYDAPTPDSKNTIFLNIGKWEIRKGHDILIQAFNRAFREDDNVELWMMNHNPFLSEKDDLEWKRLYKSGTTANQIKFIDRVKSHQDVADIMRMADCGVFPSRAEGWNLEALEMMSCGRQVIVTDYSAHTEFCSSENSHLIEIDSLEPAFDGIWFKGQGNWAELGEKQINQLSEYMRKIHEQKQAGEDIFNVSGVDTSKKFGWDNTADNIVGNF